MDSQGASGLTRAGTWAFDASNSPGPGIRGRPRGSLATPDVAQNLVGRIYDAALEPDLWPRFLADLSDVLSGSGAVFLDRDVIHQRVDFIVSSRIDTIWHEAYDAYFAARDLWVQGAFGMRAGTIVSGAAVIPTEDLVKGEFYNDFLAHQDILHLISAVVENQKCRCAFASVYRPKHAGDFGPDEHKLMGVLAPHLRRAVEIRRRFAGLEMSAGAVLDALDRLITGVIILDSRTRVLAMNRCANEIVAQRDGLGVGSAGLEAAAPRQTRELRALIGAAAQTSAGEGLAAGGGMALARPSEKRPLQVLVTPLRLLSMSGGAKVQAVAVFVSDPERQPELTADVLRRHHGLTRAEARLAAAIAAGVSLSDFADEAEISMNTARWTLKQVFAKTDTNRQAALVRLLLSGLAGLNTQSGT